MLRHSFKENTFNASMDAMSASSLGRKNNRHNLYRDVSQKLQDGYCERIISNDPPTGFGRVVENQNYEDQFRNRSNSSFSRPSKTSLPTRSSRSEDCVDNKSSLERAEKIVKIVVIGTDKTIGQVTKAFIRLKHESPSIFSR